MGMKSVLVKKTSDIPFKILLYPQTCPKSWRGREWQKGGYFMLILFQGSFTSPIQLETLSSLPADIRMHTLPIQMPATTCMLHLSHLSPSQHNPCLPHFSQNKLSPPPCQNSRETRGLKCSLPASDSMPLAAPAQWSLFQLSSGVCSEQVKCS